jgi:hypothetical protein
MRSCCLSIALLLCIVPALASQTGSDVRVASVQHALVEGATPCDGDNIVFNQAELTCSPQAAAAATTRTAFLTAPGLRGGATAAPVPTAAHSHETPEIPLTPIGRMDGIRNETIDSLRDAWLRQGRLLFPPLLAHHVEARMGAMKMHGEDRLRLDIGNTVDLLEFRNGKGDQLFAVGAEFFTWTSLREERDFHFPVDAVDYLFGVNASWRMHVDENVITAARFRLSHISAHLVDGSYDKSTSSWRNDRLPLVYSREYVELIAALEYRNLLRVYAGAQYVYHIDPRELGRFGLQSGLEIFCHDMPAKAIHPYIAYDFRTVNATAVTGTHSVQAGVKLGNWRGRGLNIFIAAYSGKSRHGEYYDLDWSYWGPGFTIDF